MPWPAAPKQIAPISISTVSRFSLGRFAAANNAALPASDWPAGAGGDMCAVPFVLPEPMVAQKLWILNGSTVAGNIQLAIYDVSYRQIVAGSVTAQVTADDIQEFDIADTPIDAGQYYIAQMQSTVSSSAFKCFLLNSTDSALIVGSGVWKQAGVGAGMPAVATPITYAGSWSIPIMGVAFRTLVK